jgi:hypothetical protein
MNPSVGPTRDDARLRSVQQLPLTREGVELEELELDGGEEDSTSGFYMLNILSKSAVTASNTRTRSSRCCAMVDSLVMCVLKMFSCVVKPSFISFRIDWSSPQTSFINSSMNNFVFYSMALKCFCLRVKCSCTSQEHQNLIPSVRREDRSRTREEGIGKTLMRNRCRAQ